MKKVGLVLSGGGARGVVHLGVLKALQELGIQIDMMAGSSAGAIVGAFHAAGYAPEEILDIMKHAGLLSPLSFSLTGHALLSMSRFRRLYLKHMPHNSFGKLQIPLTIATTDICKGKIIYLSEGELAPAIMASGCIPVVFEPIEYQGHTLYDGGILNNLPVEPLRGHCDFIIGVYVNSIDCSVDKVSPLELIDRAFHLAMYKSMHAKLKTCDIGIEPPAMSRYSVFDTKHLDEIFQTGYDYTMKMKEQFKVLQQPGIKKAA